MTKKRKKKAKKDKQQAAIKSPQLLLKEGQAYIEKGYYKEAIQSFKELLKKEDRQQWRVLLIQAYTKRAEELLQKDMPKEAFVIVQQIESINRGEKNIPLYIGVLLGTGQYKKAAAYFLDYQKSSSLESIFGSLILTGNKDVIETLPDNHSLSIHRHIVLEAIEALSQGNDELCKDLLNKISFRSPYRDWRFFLRGLIAYYNGSGEEAVEYFSKISQDIVLKSLLNSSILQQVAKVDKKLSSMNQKDMFFLMSLHGLDIKAFNVFDQLKALFHNGKFGSVFALLKKNDFYFDKKICHHLCKSFLIKDIRQKDQYEAAYERLTPFEKLRIAALVLEHKQDYKEANNYWRLCIDNIHEEANKSENEKHLAISLIFKRMAENEKHKGPSSSYDIDAWKTRMIEYLEASVKFDPYDRNPYDEIIKYYVYMDSTKETQAWIDTLVARFPEDIPALFMASNSAFERSAYKKALVFLDRIIQIDPVNKDAKAKKVFIHITKASKNIDEKKFHIARKEFEAAADCSKKNTYEYGGVLIKWGCMELLANNKQKGDDLVHEGFTLTGQGLRALFLTVVESKRMGLASSIYKKYNRLFQEQLALPVTEGKVIELIDTALPYMYTSYQDKKNDIKSVVNYLNKAVNFQFDKGNLLKICAYLKESASYRMLKTYAENGIKKWYDDGLFLYYFIWGKYEGKFHKVSDTDISKLEHAHKMAIDGQDAETVSKLDEIFDQIYKEAHPFDKIGDIRIIKDMIERIKNEEGDNFLNFFDELFERTFFEGFDEEETDKKKKRFFPKDFF